MGKLKKKLDWRNFMNWKSYREQKHRTPLKLTVKMKRWYRKGKRSRNQQTPDRYEVWKLNENDKWIRLATYKTEDEAVDRIADELGVEI